MNKVPRKCTRDEWWKFHETNPGVYDLFKNFANEILDAGITKSSGWLICNRIRWEVALRTVGSEYTLSNNYIQYYTRLFMRDHPEHGYFFDTKAIKGEEDIWWQFPLLNFERNKPQSKGREYMNGFETHGIEHLSPSQINMAMDSASAWVVSKLLKQRFSVGIPAERGKAVESGVARGLYHMDMPIADCQARAIEVFESNTALMSGLDPDERKKAYPVIENMVEMAVEQLRPLGDPIWPAETHQNRVEIKCRFKKGENGTVPIIGFLDFLYENEIVDLKTTGRLPTKMSAAHCRQAAVYARATGLPVKFLYVSPKNYRWLEPEDIDQSLDEIKAQVKRLEKFLSVSDDPKFLASIVPHNPSSFYWNGNKHLEGELDRA